MVSGVKAALPPQPFLSKAFEMSREPLPAEHGDASATEGSAPACVMSFNASDPTGAGGLSGDVSTISAMGAHPLPVVCALLLRDTAEVFEHHELEPDVVVEQARAVLEDVTVAGFKVGFMGSAEVISAVAEVISDYPDVPLVAYMAATGWMEDEDGGAYHEAFRELILPQAALLVGNHKVLTDFLLPEWDSERPPSARELAVAAAEHGTAYVLVTSVQMPDQMIDNVLATAQGAITGERFERFEASFIGAGDTLSASIAALLACGADPASATSEALAFLDQALDAGFRPGMGQVVPDRFFWALPDDEGEEAPPAGDELGPDGENVAGKPPTRRIH
jgi:hydroxymethylpyrimidine/phosphomethylpyrimidine kinase